MRNEKLMELLSTVFDLKPKIACNIYGCSRTYGLSDFNLTNKEEFIKIVSKLPIDMIYLKSLITDDEIEIYENDLENFRLSRSQQILYIKLKNKLEYALSY